MPTIKDYASDRAATRSRSALREVAIISKRSIQGWRRNGNIRIDLGIPDLLPSWKDFLSTKNLKDDVSAGLTVACVAIPLSLAIALASKVDPGVGLVTAIVAGIVCAFFGGTPLSVSGPAAAMAVLVAANVEKFGTGGLILVGCMAGVLQLVCGVLGFGRIVRFVPTPVVAGFTAGIGAIIFIGQLPRALGLPQPDQGHVIDVIRHLGALFHQANPLVFLLTLLTIAIAQGIPRYFPKLPAPLIAVGATTLIAQGLSLQIPVIGTIPDHLPMPRFPTLPSEGFGELFASAVIVFTLASLQTLLSCSVVDKITKAERHDPDQELIGQGLGNIAVSFFSGIPVSGVIVRSALNVKSGAKTARSSVIHALVILLTVYFFAKIMSQIPVASLAGILISVSLAMMSPRDLLQLWRASRVEAGIYGLTFATIVLVDLAAGVQAGILAALALSVVRLAGTKLVFSQGMNDAHRLSMSGALTFLASSKFEMLREKMEEIPDLKSLVIDLSGITDLDSSGAGMLLEVVRELKSAGKIIVLKGLSMDFHKALLATDSQGLTDGILATTESEVALLLNRTGEFAARDRLVFGVQGYQSEHRRKYGEIFRKLADNQQPHTLFITCCDSRINPNLITSTDPGELFIVRNVGNIVTPFGSDDTPAEGAAIEYSVGVLGVREIIVCGHYGCGAIKAALDGVSSESFPSVAKWLEGIRQLKKQLVTPNDLDAAAELNVLNQVETLRGYPAIARLLAKGELQLRGWIYHLGQGELWEWNNDEEAFMRLGDSFRHRASGER